VFLAGCFAGAEGHPDTVRRAGTAAAEALALIAPDSS